MPEAGGDRQAVQSSGRWPGLAIFRLTARRASLGAALIGAVFGLVIFANSAGFASAYPTAESRVALARSLGANAGLQAMFGQARGLDTVNGFVEWRGSLAFILIGAVWGLLTATRLLRGEEEAGRWEMLLSGQTTRRRAAAGALGGLGVSLAVLYLIAALLAVLAGQRGEGFSAAGAAYLALFACGGASLSMAIAAVTSQMLPTRRAALTWASCVFGAMYLVRVIADSASNLNWLRPLTPLGWIEELHPLTGGRPVMLVPWAGLMIVFSALSVFLAGRRDLGASSLPDRDEAPARTRLLGGPFGLGFRLIRMNLFAWTTAVIIISVIYGMLAKTAAEALGESNALSNIIGNLGARSLAVLNFLGLAFFLFTALVAVYAAAAAGATREEEAGGFLDNLLVRPVSRVRWLIQRIVIAVAGLVVLGLVSGIVIWAAAASQDAGVTLTSLLVSGINVVPPAIFVLGFGTLVHGLLPRFVSVAGYGLIAWSFLVEIVGSAINANKYFLDLSIFHHVSLAPAADVNWINAGIFTLAGAGLALLGTLFFNRRDLAGP